MPGGHSGFNGDTGGSGIIGIFQPNNVSGCFLWYMASSITGVANGGSIAGWADSSGSGNNLTSLTGGGILPTYQTNVLNGYPTVRFNGGGGYFVCPIHNSSIEIAASSLSIYSVYRTNNSFSQQTILVNESGGTKVRKRNFGIGINYNNGLVVTPSSIYYSWANFTGLIEGFAMAKASGTNGFNIHGSGEWIVRSDMFSATSGATAENAYNGPGYYFANAWTNIAASSNLVNANPAPLTNIYVGRSLFDNSTGFNGDIAEIIAYNFNTMDSSGNNTQYYGGNYRPLHDIILSYLSQKYWTAGSYGISLYTGTVNSTNNSTKLFLDSAAVAVTGNKTLYLRSSSFSSGIETLYINASPPASSITSNKALYITSTSGSTRTTPLYLGSTQGQIGPGRMLYIGSSTKISGIKTLFINNSPFKSTSLYIGSTLHASSTHFTPLYMGASFMAFSGTRMMTSGAFHSTPKTAPLWIAGNYKQYPPHTLYVQGQQVSTGNKSLYTSAHATGMPVSTISLYFAPTTAISSGTVPYYMPTFIHGQPKPSSVKHFNLFLYAKDSLGVGHEYRVNRTFYIKGKPSGYSFGMPLCINHGPSTPPNIPYLPLFISGPIRSGVTLNSFSLYLGNVVQQQNSFINKMYIRGLGDLDGGLARSGSMPLFLKQIPFTQGHMFVFASARASGYTTMFMSGVSIGNASGHFSMYMSGVGSINKKDTLYIGSSTRTSGNKNLYVMGIPTSTNRGTSLYETGW